MKKTNIKSIYLLLVILSITFITGRAQNTNYPVGSLNGTINVSGTGAATYTIPIEVVPGTQGVQPNLSIVYNSQSGMGLLGMKWNVSGLSAISRVPKDKFHNGDVTALHYNHDDHYALDGNHLLVYSGNYGASGSKYITEIKNFSEITLTGGGISGNTYFTVRTQDGNILEYGNSEDSRQYLNNSTLILNWMISKITDANGNYMTFHYGYEKGEIWIERIEYTGNNTANLSPYAKILFEYSTNTSDPNTFFIGGKSIQQTKLINAISIRYNNDIVRKYQFNYNFGKTVHLAEIVYWGENNSRINSTTIDWGNGQQNISIEAIQNFADGSIITGDFNGDGYADIIHYRLDASNANFWSYYAGNGNNTFTQRYSSTFPPYQGVLPYMSAFDYNGDGKDDLIIGEYNNNKTYLKYISFHSSEINPNSYNIAQFSVPISIYSGDFNSDGKTDILIKKDDDSFQFFGIPVTQIDHTANIDNIQILEYDGSGKSNIFATSGGSTYVYDYQINSSEMKIVNLLGFPTKWHQPFYGDFNGDGITDILTFEQNKWVMSIAQGDGLYDWPSCTISSLQSSPETSGTNPKPAYPVIIADFNGDGKDDIIQPVMNLKTGVVTLRILFSKGYINGSYQYTYTTMSNSNINRTNLTSYYLGDFNGDGINDLLFKNSIYHTPYIIYFDKFDQSDFVKKITDGLNNITEISYKTRYLLASDEAMIQKRKMLLSLVDSVNVSNGIGNNLNSFTYTFITPHYSGNRRTFLGFYKFTSLDCINNITSVEINGFSAQKEILYVNERSSYGGTGAIQKSSIFSTIKELTIPTNHFMVYSPSTINTNYLTSSEEVITTTLDIIYGLVANIETITRNIGSSAYQTKVNQVFNYTNLTVPNGVICRKPSSIISTSYISGSSLAVIQTQSFTYSGGRLASVAKSNADGTITTTFSNYMATGSHRTEVVSTTGSTSRTTTCTYDNTGRFMLTTTNPRGHVKRATYNPKNGNVLTETDLNNLVTTYTYDDFGMLYQVTYPDLTTSTSTQHWYTDHFFPNVCYYTKLSSTGKADGYIYYDKLGRELCSRSENSYIDTRYNSKGQIVKKSLPYPYPAYSDDSKTWIQYTYDTVGRIAKEVGPTSNITYSYSGKTHTITDNLRSTSNSKTIDAAGRLVSAQDLGGTISYSYTRLSQSGKVRDRQQITSNSVTTVITTDQWGNRLSITEPNAGTITSTYNGFNELLTETNANGFVTTFVYDNIGRVTQKQHKEGSTVLETFQYVYDLYGSYNKGRGLLAYVKKNNLLMEQYVYDEFSRLITKYKIIDGEYYSHAYTYNAIGQLETMTYPDGFAIKYAYGTNGRLSTIRRNDNNALIYKVHNRNLFKQNTKCEYGNGTAVEYSYNNLGQLTRINTGKKASGMIIVPLSLEYFEPFDPFTVDATIQDLRYEYNNKGLMANRKDIIHNQYESFTFDKLDRLEYFQQGTISGNYTYRDFTYDSKGNITYNSQVGNYTYDATKPHAVASIIPNNIGNSAIPTSMATATYNHFNQPTIITEEGVGTINLSYGAGKQRVKEVFKNASNTILHTTIHVDKFYEKDVTSNTRPVTRHYNYIYGDDGIVAVYISTTDISTTTAMYYIHTDHLGSYTAITDANKQVVQRAHFDPWGNLRRYNDWKTADNGTAGSYTSLAYTITTRGFTGHEHYSDFKIINMNGRLYDPVIARFFSPDPYVQFPSFTQNFNRYSYCLNNPLSYTDPSGYKMKWWQWALIGLGADVLTGGSISTTALLTAHNVTSIGIGMAGAATSMVGDPITTVLTAGSTLAGMTGTIAGVTYTTTAVNSLVLLNENSWDDVGKMIRNSWRINNGLFATDKNKNFWGRLWQYTSRITWEVVQTSAGYYYTQGRNLAGKVDQVEYFGGSTYAIDENVTEYNGWSGVSLGNYINAKIDGELDYDYSGGWIYSADGLFLHEYGHTFDSQRYGMLYLLAIGIPSAAGAEWTEIRANNHVWRYMQKHGLLDSWNDYQWRFPLE